MILWAQYQNIDYIIVAHCSVNTNGWHRQLQRRLQSSGQQEEVQQVFWQLLYTEILPTTEEHGLSFNSDGYVKLLENVVENVVENVLEKLVRVAAEKSCGTAGFCILLYFQKKKVRSNCWRIYTTSSTPIYGPLILRLNPMNLLYVGGWKQLRKSPATLPVTITAE